MLKHPRPRRRQQAGWLALGPVLTLLLAMLLAAFFTQASLMAEQRAVRDAQRAAIASQAADVGIAWAAAALTDPRPVDASCAPAADGRPLREWALVDADARSVRPNLQWVAQCRLPGAGDGTPVCRCGRIDDTVTAGESDAPGFRLSFGATASGEPAVRVHSEGCARSPCGDSPTAATEARSHAAVTLLRAPVLRRLPDAALTVGGTARLRGPLTLVHDAADGSGWLLDAGGALTLPAAGAVLQSRAGTPGRAALASNDEALARLAARQGEASEVPGAWATRFFAGPPDVLARWPQVHVPRSTDAAGRGRALQTAHAAGHRVFLLREETELDDTPLGTPDDPVLLLASAPLHCLPRCRIGGLVAGFGPDGTLAPGGGLQVIGAVLHSGDLSTDGTLDLRHDAAVLERLRWRTAAWLPLPGSWSDR